MKLSVWFFEVLIITIIIVISLVFVFHWKWLFILHWRWQRQRPKHVCKTQECRVLLKINFTTAFIQTIRINWSSHDHTRGVIWNNFIAKIWQAILDRRPMALIIESLSTRRSWQHERQRSRVRLDRGLRSWREIGRLSSRRFWDTDAYPCWLVFAKRC